MRAGQIQNDNPIEALEILRKVVERWCGFKSSETMKSRPH